RLSSTDLHRHWTATVNSASVRTSTYIYHYQVASKGMVMSVSRMLLVLAVASLASWWCAAAAVSREVVSVDGAVALFVLAAGSVVAGWYALTAMGHLVVALAGAAS